MNFVSPDLSPAYAEMFVLGMTCLVLVVDVFLKDSQRGITYVLSMLTLLGAAAITATSGVVAQELVFSGHFVSDPMGDVLKLVVYATTAVVFLYSRDYLRQNDLFKGEFFMLALFAMLGIMVMSLVPTKGPNVARPDATVETINLGTPLGRHRMAAHPMSVP